MSLYDIFSLQIELFINYHTFLPKFFKNMADNAFEVRITIIKNSDYNLNYTVNPYTSRKADKTDSAGLKNADSAFSVDLSKASNSSKVDTIELSQHHVRNTPTFPEVKNQIISDLNEDKDAAYLANLKEQINSNQYTIDPLKIAKDILTESHK